MAKFIQISPCFLEEVLAPFPQGAAAVRLIARSTEDGLRIRLSDLYAAQARVGEVALPPQLIDTLRAAAGTTAPRGRKTRSAARGSAYEATSTPASSPPPSHQELGASKEERPALAWRWSAAHSAVIGASHLRAKPPKPCQDAALADASSRPLALIADGAGSAPLSHLGAEAVVLALRRLTRTLDPDFTAALDSDIDSTALAQALAEKIVGHASGVLDDLADLHCRSATDFRCTLLMWVLGTRHSLWVKVGDGALVLCSGGELRCVGPVGKREFANQTQFIGPGLKQGDWAWGVVESHLLTGAAAMSDGTAERCASGDGARVAPAIGKLLEGLAVGKVGNREIFDLLAERSLWERSTGDDKCLAMLSREGGGNA